VIVCYLEATQGGVVLVQSESICRIFVFDILRMDEINKELHSILHWHA
jgi:hypothetical protein